MTAGAPSPARPAPLEADGCRGLRYAPLPDGLAERAAGWLRAGAVDAGEPVRPDRLHRLPEGLAVKLYGPPRRFPRAKALLTRPVAYRWGRLHARLAPAVATPSPLLALGPARGAAARGVVVYRWIDGRFLTELWRDRAAREAYPAFLAAMHARRVFHGDLHLHNAIWDGARWVLLDLDGVRHRLRCLAPRRLAEDAWARTWFGLASHRDDVAEADVRALFDAYAERSDLVRDRDRSWERVRRLLTAHRAAQRSSAVG